MTAWQAIPAERLMLYSPIGLRLVDDFTGRAPIGRVRVLLDRRDAAGGWEATDVQAVRTPSDVVTFPGLGRSAQAGAPPTRYRVRIEATYYRPDYLMTDDGIEFDVHPYDDSTPPAAFPMLPQGLFLMPAPNYPYPNHVRVLRGEVRDAANDPVANAEVTESVNERVLTDARGGFALPLRWPPLSGAVPIDAVDHRPNPDRTGQIIVTLPADLASGQVIVVT